MFQLSFGITNKQPALFKENIKRDNNFIINTNIINDKKKVKYTIFRLEKKMMCESIHILLILDSLSQLHVYNTLVKIVDVLPPGLKQFLLISQEIDLSERDRNCRKNSLQLTKGRFLPFHLPSCTDFSSFTQCVLNLTK